MRVRAAESRTIRRTGYSRTRCGGQERRSRRIGSETVEASRDQQLGFKPPRHRQTPPAGHDSTRIPSYRWRGFCGYVVPRVCVARHTYDVMCSGILAATKHGNRPRPCYAASCRLPAQLPKSGSTPWIGNRRMRQQNPSRFKRKVDLKVINSRRSRRKGNSKTSGWCRPCSCSHRCCRSSG